MQIKVITPDKHIFDGEISQAKFPGVSGGFEILKGHAPLISTLGRGEVFLNTAKEGKKIIQIDGGVVEVINDNITVLVEKVLA
jgi:F-type H+-transporting ATPase subunit epsilon